MRRFRSQLVRFWATSGPHRAQFCQKLPLLRSGARCSAISGRNGGPNPREIEMFTSNGPFARRHFVARVASLLGAFWLFLALPVASSGPLVVVFGSFWASWGLSWTPLGPLGPLWGFPQINGAWAAHSVVAWPLSPPRAHFPCENGFGEWAARPVAAWLISQLWAPGMGLGLNSDQG